MTKDQLAGIARDGYRAVTKAIQYLLDMPMPEEKSMQERRRVIIDSGTDVIRKWETGRTADRFPTAVKADGRPPLTKKQVRILRYIARHINKRGYQPSFREIGKRFGIASPNGVTFHLQAAEKKGYVRRASSARSLVFPWKQYL